MKTCQNCRCVYADDYNGKCADCGAEMGNQAPGGNASLGFGFARQIQAANEEASIETSLRRGDYSRVRFGESLLDVARAGAFLLEKAAGRGDEEAWS